jgi:hypothetical protein
MSTRLNSLGRGPVPGEECLFVTSGNDSQWLWKRYVSRRAALRAGILGAAIPGILYVAKSADSADAADSNVYIPGAPSYLELGRGWPGKEANAGKITYRQWSDALDIVGAGSTAGYRKVKIWDDLYVQGLVNLRAYIVDPQVPPNWTAFLYARSINGQTKPFWKDTTGTAQPLVARSATQIVAASNASPRSKLGADFVCDGTNDEVEIKAAHDALPPGGGTIVLSDGKFNLGHTLNLSTPAGMTVIIRGQGMEATTIDCPVELKNPAESQTTHCGVAAYAWAMPDRNALITPTAIQGELVFEDLEIAGHQANSATPQYVCYLYGLARVVFNRCYVHDFAQNMVCEHIDSSNPAREYRIENCRLEDLCSTQLGYSELVVQRANQCANFGCFGAAPKDGVSIVADNVINGVATSIGGVPVVSSNAVTNSAGSGVIIVENNHFHNPNGSPIGWDNGQDNSLVVVRGNRVTRDSGIVLGILIDGLPDTLHQNSQIVIDGNYLEYSSLGYGVEIMVRGYSNVTIRDNVQRNCASNQLIYVDRLGAGGLPENVVIEGNKVVGTDPVGTGSVIMINATRYKVHDNIINYPSIANYAIQEASGAGPGEIYNNDLSQANVKTIATVHPETKVWGNRGFVTENNGTATIGSGNTYVDVPHGLSRTPDPQDVSVTPTNNLGNASKFWISNVGATTLRINVNTSPGAAGATFAWHAEVL